MTTGRPYVWDVAGRAKWDAWNSHGDMKQADAKQKYVALVAELSRNGNEAVLRLGQNNTSYETGRLDRDVSEGNVTCLMTRLLLYI